MTTDIKIRLVLDRSGYSQAVSQAASEASTLGRGITASASQASRSLDGLTSGIKSVGVSLVDIAKGAVVFNALAAGAQKLASAITAIPNKGFSFLAETETAQLGLAGIAKSMLEVDGKAMSFTQAQDEMAASIGRLQKAAAETAASSSDLIGVFQALLGPAMAAGMSMQQLEEFTKVGTNAVKSMGLSTGQIVQELRDLVQGGITASGSTLATALGLKDADIAKAKASSEGLFSFLMGRMAGFSSSAEVYSKTLKGSLEALEEQITQASASAMAPAANEAKRLIASISEALQGDGLRQGLAGIGEGLASSIRVMGEGVAVAREYSGAIGLVAVAYAALKVGQVASELAQVAQAKVGASAASRLAAAQAALEASASDQVTQSSRQQLAALLAEERAKVALLAQEQALTAARLRTAEALAAQLVGQARLNALEQQVLPLRQQQAQQATALEAAQQRLTAATTASSIAARGMGLVMGALGGPIGIAITAVTLLAGVLMSARSEAEKLGKTNLSVDRIEKTLASGGQVDSVDAGRVGSALNDAKEQRDALLAKTRDNKYSMYDRSGGMFGGESTVEKDRKALAEAEAQVARYESVQAKIDAAQRKGLAAQAAPGGASSGAGTITASRTVIGANLDKQLEGMGGIEQIRKASAEKLAALETAAKADREAMVRSGASQQEIAARDKQVASARVAIQKDLQEKLKTEQQKGLGEISQIATAQAALDSARAKVAADAQVRTLEEKQARLEAAHQAGVVSDLDYEQQRTQIAKDKADERIKLIDLEIAAEQRRKPKDQAESLARDTKLVSLRADRDAAQGDKARLDVDAGLATDKLRLDRQRQIAAENEQVWQSAYQRIEQLKASNDSAAAALITDPAARARREVELQIAEVEKSLKEQIRPLQIQVDITTDEGQREQLQQQISALTEETGRSVELVNRGLTERLKPGWQTMVEGWRDTQRLMRDASDQTMQDLLRGGEDAFVGLMQTGKLNVKGLVDSMIADFARVQFRQFMAGQGSSLLGTAGSLISSLFGGAAASAKGNVITASAFANGAPFTNKIVSAPTYFRFGAGGSKLGLMGEAGPEAIMPMPGGKGVQAISPDGRPLQTLGLGRDGSGRLSVVIPPGAKFAAGGAFGASTLTGGANAGRGDTSITGGQVSLTVSNDGQMLGHINRMMAAQQRDLLRRLELAGIKI